MKEEKKKKKKKLVQPSPETRCFYCVQKSFGANGDRDIWVVFIFQGKEGGRKQEILRFGGSRVPEALELDDPPPSLIFILGFEKGPWNIPGLHRLVAGQVQRGLALLVAHKVAGYSNKWRKKVRKEGWGGRIAKKGGKLLEQVRPSLFWLYSFRGSWQW